MKQQRRQYYQQQTATLSSEILRRRKRSTAFVVGELSAFALILAAVAAYTATETGALFLYVAALMAVGYGIIRWRDVVNSNCTQLLENRRSVYQRELQYQKGDYSAFADGKQYLNPQHPYTLDMDIFGPSSLFQRINRSVTTGGSDWLANELSEMTCQQIADRQEALRELADLEPLRTQFMANGQQSTIDTGDVLTVLQSIEDTQLPHWPKHGLSMVAAWIAITGLITAITLAALGIIAADVPIAWGIIQFTLVYGLHSKTLRTVNKAVNKLHKQLQTYITLIVTIAGADFKCHELQAIKKPLSASSLQSFHELQAILNGLDRRGNQLGLFLGNALGCSDFFLTRRFLKWKEHYLTSVETWIEAVSHFDALVSMATFRYNEPAAHEAEVIDDTKTIVYEGEALSHPFLGERGVANDFCLQDNHYYIVTGANMAGKSTFLRTIGVNYILARCGMPVFASRLRVSRFRLFSSMRTTDDLTHGISYFNAELLRLQQLMEFCRHGSSVADETNNGTRTLIILDEILKGTNSLDKLNGSRLFLEHISQLPVTGIIATHDLELSRMAGERFHNYCFEIELSDHVTYTYKITEGVARNQNATFLLRNIVLNCEK